MKLCAQTVKVKKKQNFGNSPKPDRGTNNGFHVQLQFSPFFIIHMHYKAHLILANLLKTTQIVRMLTIHTHHSISLTARAVATPNPTIISALENFL